jgi:hypothetical protein
MQRNETRNLELSTTSLSTCEALPRNMVILYLILQIKRDQGYATEWVRTGILCEILSEFGVRSGVTFVTFKASPEDTAC